MAESPGIERSDVYSLFPTLVWRIELERAVYEWINARVLPFLRELRGKRVPKAGESWQSSVALHEREELSQLVSSVETTTRHILRFLREALLKVADATRFARRWRSQWRRSVAVDFKVRRLTQ